MSDQDLAARTTEVMARISEEGVGALRDEIKGLQEEARRLNLHTTTMALASISIVSLGATLIRGEQRPLALLLVTLLLGAVATYQFNISAQSSAVAEQRDRLYVVANSLFGFPVYLERSVADLRRGSIGTVGAYATAGGVILCGVAFGLVENWSQGTAWRWSQVGATVLVLVATGLAARDFFMVRGSVNSALDAFGLRWARPPSAPTIESPITHQMRRGTDGLTVEPEVNVKWAIGDDNSGTRSLAHSVLLVGFAGAVAGGVASGLARRLMGR